MSSRVHASEPVPFLLLGGGYTASRLARRLLERGDRVRITRRTPAGAAATAAALGPGAEVRVADLTEPASLRGLIEPGAVVVHSAPPASPPSAGRGGTTAEARLLDLVAADETRLVDVLASAGARRLVYLSSTGVYPPGAGAWIDEDVAPAPAGALGRRRLAAERALLEAASRAGLSAVALRAAGIYGPGRGVHVRIAAGTYQVLGDGAGYVSRIQVDDLGSAILAAAHAADLARSAYNVADDEPTRARDHADAVARLLGVPPPPSVPVEQASPEARDLLGGDRRISNRRLRDELGVDLAFPTWREGLAHALGRPS
ncbi:MAG TPA: NAD-dependent epimerase/dehydratase family protein [Kofleriaceae bacterium]|nr:NAD-dependent epimerase/dehydratase family protein [Kofleriaceae bacterium]